MNSLPQPAFSNAPPTGSFRIVDFISTGESGDAVALRPVANDAEIDPEVMKAQFIALNQASVPGADRSTGDVYLESLEEHSDLLGVCRGLVDGTVHAIAIIRKMKQSTRAILQYELRCLRADFASSGDSMAETLLIEQILVCYLRRRLTEGAYEEAMQANPPADLIRAWDGRLESSQKRYTQSIDALVRVRRILLGG